ncbi:MAG: HEAT repeat domain-containing protein [bacterium]
MNTEMISEYHGPNAPEDFLKFYRKQMAGRWLKDSEQLSDFSNDKLIERFEGANPADRIQILIELSRREDPQLQDFYENIIKADARNQEKILAMIGLGQLCKSDSADVIIQTLRGHEDPTLLSVGIKLLEYLDIGRAQDLLIEFLQHSSDEIKFHASVALSNLNTIDNQWLVDSLGEILEEVAEPSDSLKYYIILLIKERPLPTGRPLLERLLEDESVGVFAIEALGELRTNQALELVEPYLDDEDPIKQFYAAEALGEIGDDRCWDKLEELCEDSDDPHVRYYSTWALSQIDPHESVEILLKKLRDEEPGIRSFASNKLVELGDVVIEPYRQALHAKEREAVKEALYVLGEIGDEEVVPELLDQAYSADKEIEHYAIQALHKVARYHDQARQQLYDHLPEADPELKVNIIRVLNELGDSELCCYLSRYLKADDSKLRFYIAGVCDNQPCSNCLHLLRRLCKDDNLSVATFAVKTLLSLEDPMARKLAAELARDEIRPLVLVAYLRGFYLSRSPEFQDVVEEILLTSNEEPISFYAGAALKAINADRFKQLSKNDEYLQKINNRVRVD